MSSVGGIFFSVCAAIAVLSAFGTIASRTPIRAAMSLLAHILSLALLYLSLHAQLLAAMQLIVYAGAVVVLFVFVIMLIGPTEEPRAGNHGAVPRALGLCMMAAVGISVASGVGHIDAPAPAIAGCPPGVAECDQFGGVKGIASVLYTDDVVPFELVSILLLVAILGAIAVARGRSVAEAKRLKAIRMKEDAEEHRDVTAEVPAASGG